MSSSIRSRSWSARFCLGSARSLTLSFMVMLTPVSPTARILADLAFQEYTNAKTIAMPNKVWHT
jgi:hypothetical protein